MAVNGHIKFLNKSKCLLKDGATISVSSGSSSKDYAIDQNASTVWRSSGSTDLSTETIEVNFDSVSINRIFLVGHNLKDFNIQYDLGGTWTHFSSVIGLDGAKANITETVFADDTAYYEFASVTTTKIRIQALKTQTANQEKYISQIIVTSEVGTFAGWPRIKSVDITRNQRTVKTLSGFYSVQKALEVPSFDMELKDYPSTSTYNVDFDLIMTLHDLEDPFLVWLCGGKRGTTFFKYTLRGWRLKDIFQMQIAKGIKLSYSNGIYSAQINTKIELEAVI